MIQTKQYAVQVLIRRSHIPADLQAETADPDARMRLRSDTTRRKDFVVAWLHAHSDNQAEAAAEKKGENKERVVTVAQLADVIEYMVQLLGERHVGLGGDVNGTRTTCMYTIVQDLAPQYLAPHRQRYIPLSMYVYIISFG